MTDTLLVINAGSSSLKFQVFAIGRDDHLKRLIKGQLDGIGSRPRLVARDTSGASLADETWLAEEVMSAAEALEKVVQFLRAHIVTLPIAVGHRVVHGGTDYTAPTRITAEVIDQLQRFEPLAPLHQPHNLAPIRRLLERQPDILQVACFDTAFHRGHPEVADRFAIPEHLYDVGVRRYGFHGLSYEYVSKKLGELAPEIAGGRVVVAHLGSGASMCAISSGRSVDSTMGFTALDGLPMGTRPGHLDAGVVLYLMTEKGMAAKEIETLLYKECGLKGLSGISNDVRELLASADPRAAFALDYFVYRIALFTGMMAAAMEGLDGFVFTAGIGENAPAIRAEVCKRIAWLGVELNERANSDCGPRISTDDSAIACFVVPTDEELMIARHTLDVLRSAQSKKARPE